MNHNSLSTEIVSQVEKICHDIYGAAKVEYSDVAEEQLAAYEKLGYGDLPVCMAKTHLSFSADPLLKGAPEGFTVTVREARASVGAGFVYLLLGSMMTIPGLPTRPGFYDVDLAEDGSVIGLF
jgi:methylenetetrahydrofolate dehydrogenase (NADP+)/methenyltetrahydrofolate cyclohydrolase/formyltetrahydrofolate synthetase